MKAARYEVQGTLMSYPREQDWTTVLRTDDPVQATRVVHETEGTFWRRLLEDGRIVLPRV
ncbi:hypothetical protein ACN6LI_003300 [Streptomyces violaceoruber]